FFCFFFFFFSSRRRHTRFSRDWSSDVCSSDLTVPNQRRNPLQVLPFRLRCAVFPTANSDLRNVQHDRRVHHSEIVGLAPRTQRIRALPATQFLLHGMRSRLYCQHCCDPPFLVFVVSTSDRRIPFWGRIFSPPFSLSARLVVPAFPQAHVPVFGNNDRIEQGDAKQFASGTKARREFPVLPAWFRVAARVVVGNDDRPGVQQNGGFVHFPRMRQRAAQVADANDV